jgi:pilus assembly protein CpaD
MSKIFDRMPGRSPRRPIVLNALAASVTALAVGACMHDQGPMVAGWAITDPSQRHPIMVSQEPATIAFKVRRGAYGLTPQQRAQLMRFIDRYQAEDAGNSRLFIHAPSGAANEVDTMQAVAEIRDLLREAGFDEASVMVTAYQDSRSYEPPIRISYMKYTAEAPECGYWGSNLAEDPLNVGTPNLGCAAQANFAAMVANPADLLGPRNASPRASERRDVIWQKYTKGESTVAQKSADERAKVDIGQ